MNKINLAADFSRRRETLGIVYDKWAVQIAMSLSSGVRRYGELRRELGGVTPKVLTETLRHLEQDGLVQRKVYAVVPPKVEYSLTTLGKTLVGALDDLCGWAQQHHDDVEEARERFETSHSKTGE